MLAFRAVDPLSGAGSFLIQQFEADISLVVVMNHVSVECYWEENMWF